MFHSALKTKNCTFQQNKKRLCENVYLGDSHLLLLHGDILCDHHCLRPSWVHHPIRWRRYLNWSSYICIGILFCVGCQVHFQFILQQWVWWKGIFIVFENSYLLSKSDDDHIDNDVEKKVGDWDPVLKWKCNVHIIPDLTGFAGSSSRVAGRWLRSSPFKVRM